MRRILFMLCGVAVGFAFVGLARATSYADPVRQEIQSSNHAFVLVVDPETEIHQVSATTDPASVLWQFELPVWHFPFVLSNDGQTVAVVAWRHVNEDDLKVGDCVTFFSAGGSRTGIPFREVYSDPPKTSEVGIGPIGDFWRTWYHEVESHDDLLVIHTTGGGTVTFDLRTRAMVTKRGVGFFKPKHLRLGVAMVVVAAVMGWVFRRRIGGARRSRR